MNEVLMLAALCAVAACACGCAGGGQASGAAPPAGRVLFDFEKGTTGRAHCTVVDDPFGGGGKVIRGEAVESNMNKTSFFNDAGFFTVPADWKGAVVLRVAVRKERKFRVVLVAESGALKSYYPEAAVEGGWCNLVLPLKDLAAKMKPGEKVVDVSVWQIDGAKGGALYVDRAVLVAEPY